MQSCHRQLLALAALGLVSLPAAAGLFSGPDPDWKEGGYELPAPPNATALREFDVGAASPHRFLIDEQSVTVGDDRVVRYTLVVRSAGGAENATFEGIRCDAGAWRMYATARRDGEWARARNSDWRPIVDSEYNRPRAALANDFFCDGSAPPRDRDEVLRRLRGTERHPLKPAA